MAKNKKEKQHDMDDIWKDSKNGLIVYTDGETGVQYLVSRWGGITPRLDHDGTIKIVK